MIILSYVSGEPFYEKIKDSLKQKYNIPIEKLDIMFKDISDIYDYVVSKIDIPKEKLEFYFASDDDNLSLGHLLMSFVIYNDDIETINNFLQLPTQEKIRRYIYTLCENTDYGLAEIDFSDFNDKYYINYINNSSLESDVKLKYILLYYNLEDYLKEICAIVDEVILILKEKQNILQLIADEYQKTMSEEVGKYGDKILENYDIKVTADKDMVIYPLIIRANTLILKPWLICPEQEKSNVKNAYIGVHVKVLFDLINIHFIDDDRIISTLKALGDRSKFDILKSIKDNKMYGVEIARMLNLTTATVSHHMSNLYNLSLINFVTDNNKMNYMLNKEKIAELINALDNIFLK